MERFRHKGRREVHTLAENSSNVMYSVLSVNNPAVSYTFQIDMSRYLVLEHMYIYMYIVHT